MSAHPDPLPGVIALQPMLRARADEVERVRRLPEDLARELERVGGFALFAPAWVTGSEPPYGHVLRVVEAAAEGDGSVGWTLAQNALGHLILRLTVDKRQSHVAAYSLSLAEPYYPVLAVKMNELEVNATFSPPAPASPSLPVTYTSRFKGRMLFIGTEETLRVTYSDFAHSP